MLILYQNFIHWMVLGYILSSFNSHILGAQTIVVKNKRTCFMASLHYIVMFFLSCYAVVMLLQCETFAEVNACHYDLGGLVDKLFAQVGRTGGEGRLSQQIICMEKCLNVTKK